MSMEGRSVAFSKCLDAACLCELVHSVRLSCSYLMSTNRSGWHINKPSQTLNSFTFGKKVYFVIFIEKFYFFPLQSGLDSFRFWCCKIYRRCKAFFSECSTNQIVSQIPLHSSPILCFCKYGMQKRRDAIPPCTVLPKPVKPGRCTIFLSKRLFSTSAVGVETPLLGFIASVCTSL